MGKIDINVRTEKEGLGFTNENEFIWFEINNDLKAYGFKDDIEPTIDKVPESIRPFIVKFVNNIFNNLDKPNVITKGYSLIIEGTVGSGKTMTAKMIARAARGIVDYRSKPVIMVVNPINIIPINNWDIPNDSRIKNMKLLIVDDLGASKYNQTQLEYIIGLLMYRADKKLSTIITTNSVNNEIFNDERLVDRMRTIYKILTVNEPSQRINNI